jgi:hypothetical protein
MANPTNLGRFVYNDGALGVFAREYCDRIRTTARDAKDEIDKILSTVATDKLREPNEVKKAWENVKEIIGHRLDLEWFQNRPENAAYKELVLDEILFVFHSCVKKRRET